MRPAISNHVVQWFASVEVNPIRKSIKIKLSFTIPTRPCFDIVSLQFKTNLVVTISLIHQTLHGKFPHAHESWAFIKARQVRNTHIKGIVILPLFL